MQMKCQHLAQTPETKTLSKPPTHIIAQIFFYSSELKTARHTISSYINDPSPPCTRLVPINCCRIGAARTNAHTISFGKERGWGLGKGREKAFLKRFPSPLPLPPEETKNALLG